VPDACAPRIQLILSGAALATAAAPATVASSTASVAASRTLLIAS
jgi:hypothetical protein